METGTGRSPGAATADDRVERTVLPVRPVRLQLLPEET